MNNNKLHLNLARISLRKITLDSILKIVLNIITQGIEAIHCITRDILKMSLIYVIKQLT